MTKCVICERRPQNGDGQGYCSLCNDKLVAEGKRRTTAKPLHFLTYRGHVVGLFANGDGRLSPRLLQRSDKNLPKRITLDLNHYCEGFTRAKIKEFKACVLQLAHA